MLASQGLRIHTGVRGSQKMLFPFLCAARVRHLRSMECNDRPYVQLHFCMVWDWSSTEGGVQGLAIGRPGTPPLLRMAESCTKRGWGAHRGRGTGPASRPCCAWLKAMRTRVGPRQGR